MVCSRILGQYSRSMSRYFSVILLAVMAQGAFAITLRIDSVNSAVTHSGGMSTSVCYFDASGGYVCDLTPASPLTFAISGDIDLTVVHEHLIFDPLSVIDRDLLLLVPSGVATPASAMGFSLPIILGLLSGTAFSWDNDPCFLPYPGVSCSGGALDREFGNGSWDGNELVWNGTQFLGLESFDFTITATLLSVPEPNSLALFAIALLVLLGLGYRRAS